VISRARHEAYRALRAVHASRADLPDVLAATRDRLSDVRDRALAAEIVLGTLRWRAALDHVLARFVRQPLTRLDAEVLDLLRMAAYQRLFLARVPASAIVNDAVELARMAGKSSATGLVNAVARRLPDRISDAGLPPPPKLGPHERAPGAELRGPPREQALAYLSASCSLPRWLAERWLDRLGFDAATSWASFALVPAPLMLRVNTMRTSGAALTAALRAEGVEVEPARFAPEGLLVATGNPLQSPLAAAGDFVVQDEASQLVPLVAGAAAGERIFDACASPGGKTLALLSAVGPRGLVVAADVRQRRIALLRETLARAGAPATPIVQLDLTGGLPFGEVFDCVLVDAPCTGLGTIRRDPDIKWRRDVEAITRAAALQRRILREAARAVRPGGRLVYATCSSEPEENDDVVRRFLGEEPAFQLERPELIGTAAAVLDDVFLRSTPDRHGLEPFFGALLRKAAPGRGTGGADVFAQT
jgi:16S rRNA (cytosine967-C5)-methyltransferase